MTTAVVLSRLLRAMASSTSACAAAVACSSDTLVVLSAAARIALRPFSHWHDSTCRTRGALRFAPAKRMLAVRSQVQTAGLQGSKQGRTAHPSMPAATCTRQFCIRQCMLTDDRRSLCHRTALILPAYMQQACLVAPVA